MADQKSESGFQFDSRPTTKEFPSSGIYPYRSGIHEEMYRSKPWTIRQYSGFGSPLDANKRLKALIAAGVSGLSIAFDLPTQMGFDSDADIAAGEVGKVGVSINHLGDMRDLFSGIDISKISTSMTINATAPMILIMYQLVAEEQGIEAHELRGTIQNDLLKEFISRGTYIFPPKHSLDLAIETILYCKDFLPNWNPISFSGYHMAEAGANPVQEIAFTFANAIEHLKRLTSLGVEIDSIAPQLTFFFATRITLLEEVAKFRAAREVWAGIMQNQFKASDKKSLKLRFHTQTAGVELIANNPYLNLVRVTIQALGAIFGGTQSLHTNAFDEAIRLPNEDSATFAIRTQQIIMKETDLTSAIDPFQGSYVVENMTDEFVKEIKIKLEEIEKLGGSLRCIEQGYQSSLIEENAFKISQDIDSGRKRVVGLNFLEDESSVPTEFGREESSDTFFGVRFEDFKLSRNLTELNEALVKLKTTAFDQNQILPSLKECIKAGATIGEMSNVLRECWGTHTSRNSI
jgi:methylmalonyl-CoA mutase N-terminal domain/subunit